MQRRTLLISAPLLAGLAACSSDGPSGEASGESGSATNSEALSDPRVRKALAHAIDMEGLIEGLLQGRAKTANAMMPESPYKPTEGLEEYAYDPDLAQTLLDEAGWDTNRELDLVYYYGDQETVDLMAAVQQYLSQVGVKVAPRKLEGDLATQLWVSPEDKVNGPAAVEWDLAYAAVAALAPHEYYDRFSVDDPGNSYWPQNDEFQALIDATSATLDVPEQENAFHEAVAWDNANLPALPLYYQPVFVIESDRVDRGDIPIGNEQFNYDWQINTWEVEADAAGVKTLQTNGGPMDFFETPFVNPGLHMSTKVLFDHLIVADENLAPKAGQLAEEYTVSEDGLTIELILREGVLWHDEQPITAEDVKFTLEFIARVPAVHALFSSMLSKLEGGAEFIAGDAEEITGVAIDDRTITLTFTDVDPSALVVLTQLPPLPKAHLESVDPLTAQQASFFQNPIGSGPFRVKDVQMNNFATFEAWDGYWQGRATIDEISMYPSGETNSNLVKNVEAGMVDYAYSKSVTDAVAMDALEGFTVHDVDVFYTRLFFVNSFPRA